MLALADPVSLLSLVYPPHSSLLYVRSGGEAQNRFLEPTLEITEQSHSGKAMVPYE